jgi:hypothetical protein
MELSFPEILQKPLCSAVKADFADFLSHGSHHGDRMLYPTALTPVRDLFICTADKNQPGDETQ